MLLQEHVSMLLKPNHPQGWEEEMDTAGFVRKQMRAVLDSENTDDVESEKSDEE